MRILILEDNQERIDAFTKALKIYPNLELFVWRDAHSFIRDVDQHLEAANFISLDHDLVSETGIDPGDGLEVAEYLRDKNPICPVIIHTTNVNRSWSMLRELKDGNWQVERHPPVVMGVDWIYQNWIEVVRKMLRD